MLMAMEKQAITMATQTALIARDLELEMCTNPWIVELSKNSHIRDLNDISTDEDKTH